MAKMETTSAGNTTVHVTLTVSESAVIARQYRHGGTGTGLRGELLLY
jgi:hypothetical protein